MDRLRDKIIPVTAILAALVVVWYGFAILLNAPFQRDLDRRAGETPGFTEFLGKTLSQPKPTLPAPHQVAQNFFENTFMRKITSNRSLVYHALGDALLDAARLRLRHGARHIDRGRHRARDGARPQPDAVDHRLADHSHPRDRADGHRLLLGPFRHAGHRDQGADLDLSVLLPGRGRHGEGAALARDHASRPDAHLQCQPVADLLEAARFRPRCRSSSPR